MTWHSKTLIRIQHIGKHKYKEGVYDNVINFGHFNFEKYVWHPGENVQLKLGLFILISKARSGRRED